MKNHTTLHKMLQKRYSAWLFPLLLFLLVPFGDGQAQIANDPDSACLYIPFKSNNELKVHEISRPVLCVSFDDKYGKNPNLKFVILNWKNQELAHLTLDKSYGLNEYSIDLGNYLGDIEIDQLYKIVTANDMGRSLSAVFKVINPPDQWDPIPDIIPNEIEVYCDLIRKSMVEYYGKVTGGKAPYEVMWYVFKDKSPESLMYQPEKLIIEKEGDVPFISVNEVLDYYVLLHVKDACGTEQDKVVHIVCDEKEEGKLNVLFEPMDMDLFKGNSAKEIGGVN